MKYLIVLIIGLLSIPITAQEIKLQNPSFEEMAEQYIIKFWDTCNYRPSVTHKEGHPFQAVRPKAIDGKYFLTLWGNMNSVPNSNSITGQKLSIPLKKNNPFHLRFYAGTGYDSNNFTMRKGRLQIFLGKDMCSQDQLIFERDFTDTVFERVDLNFVPEDNYNYISFGVWNEPNAHRMVFVDHISSIFEGFYTSTDDPSKLSGGVINIGNKSLQIIGEFEQADLKLYNPEGKLILSRMVNVGEPVSVSQLPDGVYFYQLFGDRNTFIHSGKIYLN